MKKKILSLLFIIAMTMGVSAISAFADWDIIDSYTNPDDGITYQIYIGEYTAKIVGSNANEIGATDAVIPDMIPNYNKPITEIGDEAFYLNQSLLSITIPDTVTTIGNGAFDNCKALQSITIPESVTAIGENTFNECNALESITLPNTLTSIGDWAFAGCFVLESITLPNSLTSVGEHMFEDCFSLTSIYYAGADFQLIDVDGFRNLHESNWIVYIHPYYSPERYLNAYVDPTRYKDGYALYSEEFNPANVVCGERLESFSWNIPPYYTETFAAPQNIDANIRIGAHYYIPEDMELPSDFHQSISGQITVWSTLVSDDDTWYPFDMWE